ncbi:MAG: aldolase/citrate lyase family protein [Planctomycetaceae bacterium]|nr:aldolase/citrate lyase family protein [Planctomycetaceae bacterium]
MSVSTFFTTDTNPLRDALNETKPVFGLFVSEIKSPWLAAMVNEAGYDFCVFDMEHGTFSLSDISAMTAAFCGGHCTPLVRIPSIRRDIITPLLDLGIGGIVVPNVETADDVRTCIEYMKYPPQGSRGVSLSRPHTGFASVERTRFLELANARNLLIIQIESQQAVENLDEILSVPGIDAAFVGCGDLSLSMRISSDPVSGPLRETLEHILDKAGQYNVHGGANVSHPHLIEALIPCGLRVIAVTTDTKGFLVGISRPLHSIKH